MQPQNLGAKIQKTGMKPPVSWNQFMWCTVVVDDYWKTLFGSQFGVSPKKNPGFKVFRSFLLIQKNSRSLWHPDFAKSSPCRWFSKPGRKKRSARGFVNIEGVQAGWLQQFVTDLDPLIWRSLTFFTIPKTVTFSRRIARIWCAFKCSKTCLQEHALLLSPFFCQPGSSCTKTSVFLEPKLNVAPFGGKTVFTFNVASVRSTNASKHFLKSFHVHHLELLVLRLLSMRLPWWDFM